MLSRKLVKWQGMARRTWAVESRIMGVGVDLCATPVHLAVRLKATYTSAGVALRGTVSRVTARLGT